MLPKVTAALVVLSVVAPPINTAPVYVCAPLVVTVPSKVLVPETVNALLLVELVMALPAFINNDVMVTVPLY